MADQKRKILVIDDDETSRSIVKFHLEGTGKYEVTSASTGAEGVQAARRIQPRLILIDILMPGMSGTDVAEKLMDSPATKDIPMIFLTGAVTKDDISTQGGFVGGRRFLAKPVSRQDLISVVDSVFQ
ncbi:MAG: response regulator [Desulfobacterales bacterium]|nr:response regulator [Desulfobacterales bacterium]